MLADSHSHLSRVVFPTAECVWCHVKTMQQLSTYRVSSSAWQDRTAVVEEYATKKTMEGRQHDEVKLIYQKKKKKSATSVCSQTPLLLRQM